MIFKKHVLGLFLLGFCTLIHAGDMGGKPQKEYFFALSGGPSWTDAGTSQTLLLQPDIIKTYIPNNLVNSNLLGNAELFAGIQKSFFESVQSQFGLALYGSSFAKLNGYVQEDGDPNFQNFSYQYKISHWHLSLKSKWIVENTLNLNPYLSGSLGVGVNRSYDYYATPLILQEIAPPPFRAQTQTAFSYSFGAGFQHTVTDHVTVALGYQLVSWGSSSLNRAVGQTSSTGLRLHNLYTHGIECNVSYFL